MEQWEKNYYISAIAGANNGSSLVVMSKGQWNFITYYICGLSQLYELDQTEVSNVVNIRYAISAAVLQSQRVISFQVDK